MSIITKNEAFMLRRPDVIDLKYIAAKKYVSSVEGTDTRFYTLISRMKKYIVISALAWLLLLSLFGWGILIPNTSEASNTLENTAFLDRFPDNSEGVRVIGCYNDHTRKIREGSSCTASGDKNIMLPPRSHVEVWLKYYNPRQIVNRLGIVNFESSFREDVGNPSAHGYVQTLRSHRVAPDIDSQLSWMSKREQVYRRVSYGGRSGPVRGCGFYWKNENTRDGFEAGERGVMACLYRYHYDANRGSWYARRGMEATSYYHFYLFGTSYNF